MKRSDNDSNPADDRDVLRDADSPYKFDLPADPDFPADAPKGSWDDGYRLSLMALTAVNNRPEVFAQRDRCRCVVEFKF